MKGRMLSRWIAGLREALEVAAGNNARILVNHEKGWLHHDEALSVRAARW